MKIRVGAAYYVLLCFCVRNQYAITLYAGYVIYDDAYHVKKFATNKSRSTQTEMSQRIALMKMVVDRFHFPGHVDSWCKKHCNPNDIDELKGVRQFKTYRMEGNVSEFGESSGIRLTKTIQISAYH